MPASPHLHNGSARFSALVLAFLFVSTAALHAAPPAMVLDLASTPHSPGVLTEIFGHGSSGDGSAGVPVTGGFDCDGDGFKEIAFAQIKGDPLGRANAGEVTLIFGDGAIGSGTPPIETSGFNSGLLRFAGEGVNEITGAEIWMDDVTGDGLGDLIIGRQNYTPAAGREGAGALTIVIGDSDLKNHTASYFDLGAPPADVKLVTFVGSLAYDRLGIWMRTGDIDGDGIADIAVGADEVDQAGQSVTYNSGAVYVIRGGAELAAAPAVVDLANFGSTALAGHIALLLPPTGSSNYHMGATVQVGDLDGNGRAEVMAAAALNRAGAGLRLFGAPGGTGESSGGASQGVLFISWDENFPPCPWPAGYTFDITQPALGDFTKIRGLSGGPPSNGSFGEEIIVGEFSGDGFPDLYSGDLVGDTVNGNNSGLGFVFYNAAKLRGLNFTMNNIGIVAPDIETTAVLGPSPDAIGNDTVAVGDYDDDGIDDIAVGNPHDDAPGRGGSGTVHVLFGQPGGWPDVVDQSPAGLPGPEAMRIVRIDGAEANDTLCYSAASGDIDDNGIVDFIVNEMTGNGSSGSPLNVGNMLVISGTVMAPPVAPALSFGVAGPIDYGSQDILAGATNAVAIVITNTSGAPLNISSLTLEGPEKGSFSVSADTGEASLGAGASRTVQVVFDPAAAGVHGAALTILDDADAHMVGIGLRGIGIEPAIEPEVIEFNRSGGDLCLRFLSQAGYVYELRRSVDLQNWVTILSGIAGTGGIVPLFDAPGPMRLPQYYQVRGVPAATPGP